LIAQSSLLAQGQLSSFPLLRAEDSTHQGDFRSGGGARGKVHVGMETISHGPHELCLLLYPP